MLFAGKNLDLSRHWRGFWRDFLALRCCLCEEISAPPLCFSCAAKLPQCHNRCRTCSHRITTGERCGRCLRAGAPIDFLISRWLYCDAVKTWFWRAKFHADRVALQILSDEAARLSEMLTTQSLSAVIPMPIAPARLRQRGFNQTLFPARSAAKALNLPLETAVIARHDRPQQVKMTSNKARWQNMRGAFYLWRSPVPERVLLVDDVFTTGATLFAAANVLKQGGAKQVIGLVLATR